MPPTTQKQKADEEMDGLELRLESLWCGQAYRQTTDLLSESAKPVLLGVGEGGRRSSEVQLERRRRR